MTGTAGALRIIPPVEVSRRDGRLLMIWDTPAQWLVGDAEFQTLITLCDGTRTAVEASAELARQSGRDIAAVRAEVDAALAMLAERGLLGTGPAAVEPEPVSIANITYNLTNRCNLRCPWCYNAGRNTRELAVADVMASIHAARDLLPDDFSLNILGGEPTLAPGRLLECLELSRGLSGLPVQVSTNGTRITADLARALGRQHVEVQVSIDHPRRSGHDAIRGRGVFDRALCGIRVLRDAGVPVVISMVFGHGGESLFQPYLELARDLGVSEARFIPLRRTGLDPDFSTPLPDLRNAWREYDRITREHPDLARLLMRDFFSILCDTCSSPGCRTGCGLGRKVLLIDADGGIYPCPNLARPEYLCGNVADTPLTAAVLESPVMQRLREACHVEKRPGCSSCAVRHWCAGDCRAEALTCGGGLNSPAPHCGEIREVIGEMLWEM